ncbi:MAG: hypothetical protein AAF696_32940, partial [Bacteroidota bacterium]
MIKNILHKLSFLILFPIFLGILPLESFSPALFSQTTLSLAAEQDNTLYENPNGNTSNGKGDFLFIGRNNQSANS